MAEGNLDDVKTKLSEMRRKIAESNAAFEKEAKEINGIPGEQLLKETLLTGEPEFFLAGLPNPQLSKIGEELSKKGNKINKIGMGTDSAGKIDLADFEIGYASDTMGAYDQLSPRKNALVLDSGDGDYMKRVRSIYLSEYEVRDKDDPTKTKIIREKRQPFIMMLEEEQMKEVADFVKEKKGTAVLLHKNSSADDVINAANGLKAMCMAEKTGVITKLSVGTPQPVAA